MTMYEQMTALIFEVRAETHNEVNEVTWMFVHIRTDVSAK
jgi:hypothetical protein